ncbi:MAG: hypothetical protein JWR76_2091 [Mucilaginibacter sp.]|nr:hypothetical protein [Mucilaginibacter sp.]
MRKILLFLISNFFLSGLVVAQASKDVVKHDSVAYYMRNSFDMASSEADAKFLRLIIKSDLSLFIIQDYYLDAKPKLLTKSFSGEMNFERGTQGPYIEFYPNGNKRYERNYIKGKVIGDCMEYYPNGVLYTIINYDNSSVFLKKYQDSTGKVLAENGNGLWVNLNDDLSGVISKGAIVDGKEDGIWKKSIADSTSATIVYKKGVRKSEKAPEDAPVFPGGDLAFVRFLEKNIRYPVIARESNVKGKVILTFFVERDGSLTGIRVVRGIGAGCDEEAVRVLKLSPLWKPGIQDGHPVRVQYSIPIEFNVEYHNPLPNYN